MALSPEIIVFIGGTQVWLMKLLALFLGYRIVIVGSRLLRDGIAGEFKFQTEFHGIKADLASASPGLLFVLIGGLIIIYSLSVTKKVDLGGWEEVATQSSTTVREDPQAKAPPEIDLGPLDETPSP